MFSNTYTMGYTLDNPVSVSTRHTINIALGYGTPALVLVDAYIE